VCENSSMKAAKQSRDEFSQRSGVFVDDLPTFFPPSR
jgi:hypothetical protein